MSVTETGTSGASDILGGGAHTYRAVLNWPKFPSGWVVRSISDVGVDSKDNVYLFTRDEHPVIVLDREGTFIKSWGEGVFKEPHGVHVGPDDTLYLTDKGDNTVRKCTLDGKVLLEIGIPGKGAPFMSGDPFCQCTHTALSPRGDIYVADGYGNARVHKYSPDGKHLLSWGSSGTDEGQFNLPHNIACDADGYVYVADRENHRVQIFNGDGKFEGMWKNIHRPCSLHVTTGRNPVFYLGELGPELPIHRAFPNLGPRISVSDKSGKPFVRLGDLHAGPAPNQFLAPHGIGLDSHGDIYVAQMTASWGRRFPGVPEPAGLSAFRKLVKVA